MTLAGSLVMQTSVLSRIEALVNLHYVSLFHFALRLCDSPARAILLTQRTFRLALQRSRSLPVPANTRAWLLSILFHEFLENRPRGADQRSRKASWAQAEGHFLSVLNGWQSDSFTSHHQMGMDCLQKAESTLKNLGWN